MSSRPATPTDHTTPQPQPETIRKTRSQTRQSQLLDSRRNMIATAQYHGHNPYLSPPHHSLQDLHRREQSSTTAQFAPQGFSFDTSYNASAVTSANIAISSGSMEGRREPSQEVKVGPYKHVQDTTPGMRPIHSPSLEGSGRQSFTENERVADVPTAPSKKKRTRTLTTSNQSSVLLALLAKTPFPTTAEREEVGRAIGLTARKVQVWFQNQRQKQKKSGQTGSYSSAPQGATTSAPLPLSRQPGFSASHAARMGLHSQNSPPYSSSIAPYPSGSGNRDTPDAAQYSILPLVPAPPHGHVTEPYQAGTAYSRSFTGQSSYHSLGPGSTAESDQYQQLSQPNASGASQSFTGHSGIPQSAYVTGDFSDLFGHHPPQSRESNTHSLGYPPQSQDPSLSDDQSRPTTSRGSQPHGPSPGDSWRTKPLPPLPSEAARPSTGQSLNWDPNSPEHSFRPPVPPSRSRAFSNPDATVAGYRSGHAYVPTPATAGLTPSAAFPSSRFYTSAVPTDMVTPNTYQALSDYHYDEAQQLRHQTSSGSVGESYSLRYGDHYTSPGGISSSSSLAYSEPTGLGLPPASQHSGSITYSPIEQRTTRFSYDASLVSGQVLGKRPWTADEGRPTKRARTDDGHASLPIRTSTRGPPPSTYQHQPSPLGNQSTHEMLLAPRTNLPVSRSEDPHYHYHYEKPSSDPASGV